MVVVFLFQAEEAAFTLGAVVEVSVVLAVDTHGARLAARASLQPTGHLHTQRHLVTNWSITTTPPPGDHNWSHTPPSGDQLVTYSQPHATW